MCAVGKAEIIVEARALMQRFYFPATGLVQIVALYNRPGHKIEEETEAAIILGTTTQFVQANGLPSLSIGF